MGEADRFKVWLVHSTLGDKATMRPGSYSEPAEAADVAEEALTAYGVPGRSKAELRFNGDIEPHTVIYYLNERRLGIWNTNAARWPIYYPDDGVCTMLDGFPDPADFNMDGGSDESDADTDEDDSDTETEKEGEPMRLPIFARMFATGRSRKRIDFNPDRPINKLVVKLGVLDPEGETPKRQEENVFVRVEFIESSDRLEAGLLRIKLPEGLDISDFSEYGGFVNVRIPYPRGDA